MTEQLKPTTAFAYLRVSGHGQLSGDGFDRQRDSITRYADSHGITIVHWYEERGVSGKSEWEDRAAWSEMVTALNGTHTIIIEKLDRLARDLMIQEHIIADLRRRGIELISTHEPGLADGDPTRVLMRQIMGAIAQYDRTMTVLKLKSARDRMKKRTGRCEGQKPYGHYPGEGDIKRKIISLYANGENFTNIARMLNSEKVPTRSGGWWYPITVSRIVGRIDGGRV